MNNIKQYSILLFVNSLIYTCQCVRIIPERAQVAYVNGKYFENASLNVRRYGRRAEYVLNAEFTTKYLYGNNINMDLIFYEYLHNEFRRSFIEMHFKLCDFVLRDQYLGWAMRKSGFNTCSMPPKKHIIANMTFNFDHVPNSVWPFQKGKIELTASKDKEVMITIEMVCTFISKLPK